MADTLPCVFAADCRAAHAINNNIATAKDEEHIRLYDHPPKEEMNAYSKTACRFEQRCRVRDNGSLESARHFFFFSHPRTAAVDHGPVGPAAALGPLW